MPDPDSVTLPIHCVKCGQAVALSYTPSEAYRPALDVPYVACGTINQVIVGGTGLSAVARYESPKV